MICRGCGTEFETKDKDKTFCTGTCYRSSVSRKAGTVDRHGKPKVQSRFCALAGCENPVSRKRSRYCSTACRDKAKAGVVRGPNKATPPDETSICLWCRREFPHRPGKVRTFCSNSCRLPGKRLSHGHSKKLNEEDEGYLAGIVDGEGTITFARTRKQIQVRLIIPNTHLPLLAWILEATGVGSVHTRTRGKSKPLGAWTVFEGTAVTVLRQIEPYLLIKGPQARLAIEAFEFLCDYRQKPDETWHRKMFETMKSLQVEPYVRR